jgi:hypothetical protein
LKSDRVDTRTITQVTGADNETPSFPRLSGKEDSETERVLAK